jgi:hypothetical protein
MDFLDRSTFPTRDRLGLWLAFQVLFPILAVEILASYAYELRNYSLAESIDSGDLVLFSAMLLSATIAEYLSWRWENSDQHTRMALAAIIIPMVMLIFYVLIRIKRFDSGGITNHEASSGNARTETYFSLTCVFFSICYTLNLMLRGFKKARGM